MRKETICATSTGRSFGKHRQVLSQAIRRRNESCQLHAASTPARACATRVPTPRSRNSNMPSASRPRLSYLIFAAAGQRGPGHLRQTRSAPSIRASSQSHRTSSNCSMSWKIAEPRRKTQTGPIFHDLAERLKRRGLVLILSDLFDNVPSMMAGLKHFQAPASRGRGVSSARPGRARVSVSSDDDVPRVGRTARRIDRSAGACGGPTWTSSENSCRPFGRAVARSTVDYVLLRTDQSHWTSRLSSYLASPA